jgi:hypothetical protein
MLTHAELAAGLKDALLLDNDNEFTHAAVELLAAYDGGYWLRRLATGGDLAHLVEHDGDDTDLPWKALYELAEAPRPQLFPQGAPRLEKDHRTVLRCACSMAEHDLPVNMRDVLLFGDPLVLRDALTAMIRKQEDNGRREAARLAAAGGGRP